MPSIWSRSLPEPGYHVVLPLGSYFPETKALAHVTLACLPTPVEPLTELARLLGLRSLFVKRDDVSGEAYGGNKVRKLEFLLGQALAERRKSVLTFGARGSNHVRATAVYGKQLGLKVHAVLTPQPTTAYLEANLLADRAAGATLHLADSYRDSVERGAKLQDQLTREDGVEPFVIPFGGTVPRGTIGFVNAALELAAQVERGELPSPDVIYVPFGSMGTASGLATGFAALGLPIQVIGVRVVPADIANLDLARQVVQDAVALLREADPGFPRLEPEQVGLRVRDEFLGDGYAMPTSAAQEAVDLAAAHGLRLETTYTGKALAALAADARAGQLTGKTAVFWNTYSSRPIRRTLLDESWLQAGKMENPESPRRSGATLKGRQTALVLGGGFAGLEIAIHLRQAGLAVTLVSERRHLFVYPTSIWVVTGEHRIEQDLMDLQDLAQQHQFVLVLGRVERVDASRRLATVDGRDLAADVLVLALGAGRKRLPGMENTATIWGDPPTPWRSRRDCRRSSSAARARSRSASAAIPPIHRRSEAAQLSRSCSTSCICSSSAACASGSSSASLPRCRIPGNGWAARRRRPSASNSRPRACRSIPARS